ncbi:hypothetical protein ERO13_A06G155900v2 [Gossypium hirsutum]|uniref:Uncharacterized protein n=4 Tax=Gossypium TaxID=3633 RepID=A0A1U8PRK1_GOSHI|nr:uncharacterized protein LOC107962075 [Gossypium hirsutum]KAB2078529.1 hypothetical protein ES319_A06G169100v1 [Gossypium barbadense]KAG4196215.1 hypothetical protein ERO13_A06G155900v2 [Gossypium hirsutum]TYH14082.1 hypothetical protein ES288_A06G191000v1 [Gossypium darwinii]TYI23728.1 hypothetical protein ES332_A06G184800v1 [Gossypium tomentosum]
MDEREEHAEKKVEAVGKYHFLRNTLQIVVWVAFLSVFLCHSSGMAYSLFPHSFNVYFSTFLFSSFTHTVERKYMFLICNGILAFVAKSSVCSRSESDNNRYLALEISTPPTQTKPSVTDEVGAAEYDQHVPLDVAEAEETEDAHENEAEEQAEHETESSVKEEEEESEGSVIVEDADGEGNKEREKGWWGKQEERGGGVGAKEELPISMSTEELNRKIEEFIRKMKEEIRIEAQQQMIASN